MKTPFQALRNVVALKCLSRWRLRSVFKDGDLHKITEVIFKLTLRIIHVYT